MINTILFDLDGTLLNIDDNEHVDKYLSMIADKLKDFFNKEDVFKLFWGATLEMINSNDDKLSNEEIFMDYFFSRVEYSEDEIMPLIYDFYENEYKDLKNITSINKYMYEAVELLKSKGYDLIIATNPLFPSVATNQRVAWANMNISDFKLVTTFEDMHYTKPNINYYKEILSKVNKEPSECLMVGNNVNEDMIVSNLGMKTFLIKDYLIGELGSGHTIDYVGYSKDFLEFVEDLEKIK